jgi:hypothetical protein
MKWYSMCGRRNTRDSHRLWYTVDLASFDTTKLDINLEFNSNTKRKYSMDDIYVFENNRGSIERDKIHMKVLVVYVILNHALNKSLNNRTLRITGNKQHPSQKQPVTGKQDTTVTRSGDVRACTLTVSEQLDIEEKFTVSILSYYAKNQYNSAQAALKSD